MSNSFIHASAGSNVDGVLSITSERVYCLKTALRMLLLFQLLLLLF